MEKIWMQFTDEGLTEACGWSWWEQPTLSWPYQAQVTLSDSRYVAFYGSMPPELQPLAPTPAVVL